MRVPVFRPVLVLAAAVVLCSTGCLDFEKQTFVLTFHPERDEINVLLLYEGLQVDGKQEQDLKNAEKALKAVFAEGKGYYLGHPIVGVGVVPDKNRKPSEKDKNLLKLLVCALEARGKHLTVRKGTFFLNKEGSLCGSQEITVRQARAFVRGFNEMISADVGSMADKALADPTKKQQELFDEETLKLMQKAVKDKHQWIHFEPGRLSVTLVGSPKYFAKVKHELTNDLILSELRGEVGRPARPGQPAPRPVDPAYVQKWLQQKLKEAERFAVLVSETPWGVEQRRNRFTFSLGLGEGEPLRFFSPYVSTNQGNQAGALVAHARTLGLEIKKDATAESVIADFLRRHGPKQNKTPPKDAKLITAKVQAVDTDKGTITVTTAEGKVLVLKVDKDTSIVSPLGGKSADRLLDDRLAKGAEIKVTLAADGKTAKTIQLPFRKRPPYDKGVDKPKEKKGS